MPVHAQPGRPTGRRAVLIALPPAAVLIVAAVVILASTSGSSAGAASTAAKSSGSATVTRRDLVSTDTQSGTLGFGDPRTVYNRLSGTITSLPAAGTVVKPGGTLFTVNNAPVVLMDGPVPAYRALSDGVAAGPDVLELKQNLRKLGFDSGNAMTPDDSFDLATTAAVERWQASLGQAQTGIVALGSVVFLPGTRRISSVTASLGSAGGGSSGGASASATAASTRPAGHVEFVDLSTSASRPGGRQPATPMAPAGRGGRPTAPSSGASAVNLASLQALVALLRAETAELRSQLSAARGSGGKSAAPSSRAATSASAGARTGGSGAAAGSAPGGGAGGSGSSAGAQAVMQTTSTRLVATVPLDASKQNEAVPGEPVTVQMPDGRTVGGRISQVAAAAQSSSSGSTSSGSGASGGSSSSSSSSSSSGSGSTVPVTITLNGNRSTAGLDQAAVSVNFQQQKAAGVLAVPVTALLATAGGGYALQEATAPNRLLPVTTGLFAAGYVQVSGPGVYSGLQVTDSQG